MDINNSWSLLKLSFDLSGNFSAWCCLHDDIVTVFDNGNGGADNNDREDISGDRIKVMPIVPLINLGSFVRS